MEKNMKVIVIGSGGREHAIAYRLSLSPKIDEVVCVPGNGGTETERKCRNVKPEGKLIESAVKIAKEEKVDFAVIGPEDPLAEGIADAFWNEGIPTVGPKAKGAALEASKDLSKVFMQKYGVACADSATFTDKAAALEYVQKKGAPIVVKADGLAAGKGVVVAKTLEDALKAVNDLMDGGAVGDAGKKLAQIAISYVLKPRTGNYSGQFTQRRRNARLKIELSSFAYSEKSDTKWGAA